jgi:hypothetical protein
MADPEASWVALFIMNENLPSESQPTHDQTQSA